MLNSLTLRSLRILLSTHHQVLHIWIPSQILCVIGVLCSASCKTPTHHLESRNVKKIWLCLSLYKLQMCQWNHYIAIGWNTGWQICLMPNLEHYTRTWKMKVCSPLIAAPATPEMVLGLNVHWWSSDYILCVWLSLQHQTIQTATSCQLEGRSLRLSSIL